MSNGVRTTRDEEFYMQAMFFNFVLDHTQLCALPIYAVPNFSGHYGTKLQRVIAGQKAKRSGRRKGVPDVIVDVARGTAHGLRIEFKVGSNKPAKEQDNWHAAMREHGYLVAVCTDAEQAISLLLDYLKNGERARLLNDVCELERVARYSRRTTRAERALSRQHD